MNKRTLQQLRAKVAAIPPQPANNAALCARIEAIAAELDAMTPEQRAERKRELPPLSPEAEALLQRIERLTAEPTAGT